MTLDEYIAQHIEPEPDYLYRLWRATNIHMLHGRMASGHLQGRLLKMLVRMIHPQNILEVGTFSGYSAICMAEGLEEGGMVYTFEINDEHLSWLTIRYGMVMWWTTTTIATHKPVASRRSTTT